MLIGAHKFGLYPGGKMKGGLRVVFKVLVVAIKALNFVISMFNVNGDMMFS